MALDSTPQDPEPELAPFRLNHLMAAWNARLEARLAAAGTTFAQWRVAMSLARAGRPLAIIELVTWTLVPHSTLSRQVAAMQRQGLVNRVRHQVDGRAVAITLTPLGRARYREWLALAKDEAEVVLGRLNGRERKVFDETLDIMEEVMREVRLGIVAPT